MVKKTPQNRPKRKKMAYKNINKEGTWYVVYTLLMEVVAKFRDKLAANSFVGKYSKKDYFGNLEVMRKERFEYLMEK